MFDATSLPKDYDYIGISKKLSEALREKGVLLWNPKMVSKTLWEKQMKTTVVIPNYNGMKYIEDCLNSLEKERKNPESFFPDPNS